MGNSLWFTDSNTRANLGHAWEKGAGNTFTDFCRLVAVRKRLGGNELQRFSEKSGSG